MRLRRIIRVRNPGNILDDAIVAITEKVKKEVREDINKKLEAAIIDMAFSIKEMITRIENEQTKEGSKRKISNVYDRLDKTRQEMDSLLYRISEDYTIHLLLSREKEKRETKNTGGIDWEEERDLFLRSSERGVASGLPHEEEDDFAEEYEDDPGDHDRTEPVSTNRSRDRARVGPLPLPRPSRNRHR